MTANNTTVADFRKYANQITKAKTRESFWDAISRFTVCFNSTFSDIAKIDYDFYRGVSLCFYDKDVVLKHNTDENCSKVWDSVLQVANYLTTATANKH